MNFKSIRAIAFILMTIMILSLFSACGDSQQSTLEGNTVSLIYKTDKHEIVVDSSEKINCDYLLVYHNGSNYSEIDACLEFLEKLSKQSNATFQICPDNLNIPKPDQKVILLGDTVYAESQKSASVINEIRTNNYYDYLIRTYGNKVTVNWVSKYGREDAFERLMSAVSDKGLNDIYKSNYSCLYLSERSDFPVVTIDDINIVQYAVVLPSAPTYAERYCAQELVETIQQVTGTTVPVVTDDAEESQYEILIGDTSRGESYITSFFAPDRYAIAQYGTKLVLRGGKGDATAKAVTIFNEFISNSVITAEPLHLKSGYYKIGNASSYSKEIFGGYKLVYADEFDSNTFNTNIWRSFDGYIQSYGIGSAFMYYYPERIKVNGRNLVIDTQLNNEGYTSGRVLSDEGMTFKYGYLEVRAKFPSASGFWGKMLLSNENYKGKTVSQIDVFNTCKEPNKIFASTGVLGSDDYFETHRGLADPSYDCYRSYTLPEGKYFNEDEYHTYGVEWTAEYIRFFIDGQSYGMVEITDNKYKELHEELYIVFDVGVGTTGDYIDDESAQWPAQYSIDWVRLYQKEGSTITYKKQK